MATKFIEINADNSILKGNADASLGSSETQNVEYPSSIELTSSGTISFNAELGYFNFDLLTQHFKEDPWYLLHGDCISMLDIFAEDSVDLIVTDPPYRTITGGDKDEKTQSVLKECYMETENSLLIRTIFLHKTGCLNYIRFLNPDHIVISLRML